MKYLLHMLFKEKGFKSWEELRDYCDSFNEEKYLEIHIKVGDMEGVDRIDYKSLHDEFKRWQLQY